MESPLFPFRQVLLRNCAGEANDYLRQMAKQRYSLIYGIEPPLRGGRNLLERMRMKRHRG